MKKKLQKEIQEIAHTLSDTQSSFNTSKVKQSVTMLLEKLSVLEYLESQIGMVTPSQESALDSKSYREENWFKEPEPLPVSEHKEDIVEPAIEKIKDIVAQMPGETQQIDALLEDVLPESKYVKNDLEEFAQTYQQTPTFERKETQSIKLEIEPPAEEIKEPVINTSVNTVNHQESNKPKSLNDTVKSGLSVGLNDRLAFIKHLFEGSADDYQRVLSQINTMQSFQEASQFIEQHIKPDYNNWQHKDEYTERFMNILEKRFN